MPAEFSTLSTSEVAPACAFEYWRDSICDTFVQLAAAPVGDRAFVGRIDHARFGDLEVSTVRAGAQRVRRTPGLIARGSEAFLLASIQTAGQGLVTQDGRSAALIPGSMAFYDSTRPYTLHFDGAFEQIVVQVPLADALAVAGTLRLSGATAQLVGRDGAGGAVAEFFRSLTIAQDSDPAGVADLADAARLLLASALSQASGVQAPDGGLQLLRERAVSHLRRHLADPHLDADAVAAALHVSRRTLFRAFAADAEGVMGLLRRIRVEQAQHLLRHSPTTPVRAVAANCGFAGEVQFHRTFRNLTGCTPAMFRVRSSPGTDS